MRKILYIIYILSASLFADLIPENSHAVSQSVKITNTSNFPDTIIVGCIFGIPEANSCYTISDETLLSKGYKFNSLYLFAISSTTLESYGGVDAIVFDEDNNSNIISFTTLQDSNKTILMPITSGTLYIDNNYTMESDSYFYEISSVKEDNLTLSLKKRVITFNDGTNEKIIDF